MSTRRWLLLSAALIVAVFSVNPVPHPAAAGPAATPIVGGPSFGAAVVITPGTQYSAQVDATHSDEFFYFDVTPGQYLTLSIENTGTGGGMAQFFLYDQDRAQVRNFLTVNAEQIGTFRYMGNSTAPTRYYFKAHNFQLTNPYLFQAVLADQADGGSAGDAGDTAGTAKTLSAAQGSQTVFANNQLGYKDEHDWLKIPALSGQIISLTMRVTSYGQLGSYPGTSSVDFRVTDQGGTKLLDHKLISNPSTDPWTYSWISNNTYPSAYLVHAYAYSADGVPVRYELTVDLSQQQDGAAPGDAGDNFDTARALTVTDAAPVLLAPGNMLGASDQYDYYRLNLPVPPPMELPRRYRLRLHDIVWPGGSGTLTIKLYDGARNQIPGQQHSRTAPSVTPLSINVTDCVVSGCYLYIETNVYQGNLTSYSLALQPPLYVYLPLLRR